MRCMVCISGACIGPWLRRLCIVLLPALLRANSPDRQANAVLWQRIQKNVAAVGTCLSPNTIITSLEQANKARKEEAPDLPSPSESPIWPGTPRGSTRLPYPWSISWHRSGVFSRAGMEFAGSPRKQTYPCLQTSQIAGGSSLLGIAITVVGG